MKFLRFILPGIIFTSILITIACDEDSKVTPPNTPVLNELQLSFQEQIEALAGLCTLEISVLALDEEGNVFPGVEIEFSLDPGHGSIVSGNNITDDNGIVEAEYSIDLQESIVEEITASSLDNPSISTTRDLNITLITTELTPSSIVIDSVSADSLFVGGAEAFIYATVLDSAGNGVPDVEVNWTSSLGVIAALSITDSLGKTYSILTPYNTPGIAVITAKVEGLIDSATVEIPILDVFPSSIMALSEYDIIQVTGVGGNEQTSITAEVKDEFGNFVSDGIMVLFEITSAVPEGTSFGNGSFIDSAFTSSGSAVVELLSGTVPGNVNISATTWQDWPERNMPISNNSVNIEIIPGLPADIELSISNDPQQIGSSGSYKCEVYAHVTDTYENNVQEGTQVNFALGPEVSPWYGPQHGNIDGIAYTDPDGIATTYLYYNTENMFSMVQILAECTGAGGDIITAQLDSVVIPPFEPELVLMVEPSGFTFSQVWSIAVLKCTATLIDGAGVPINNALLTFVNSGGMYFCCDSATAAQDPLPPNWYPGDPPYWREVQYTGPNPPPDLVQSPAFHQEDGQAIMFMRAIEVSSSQYPGVFTDPTATDVVVEIITYLVNYPDISADPVSVNFRREL